MAIEDTLKRIATALEKIAGTVEVPQTAVSNVAETPAAEEKETPAPATEEKEAPPAEEKKEEKPADDGGKAPDLDAVVKALQAYLKANGREAAVELLGKYGAKRASDIAEDKRAAFVREAS